MGIKCPKCHHENPDGTLFCGKCGTQLPSQEKIEVTETLETPREELTTGSTFAGRYKIIEELGKGGMGRVYKAHDTKIKEKIALKLIKPEIAKDKKTIERFSNELRLARKIRHKNVFQMFDLGEDRGTQFITMEFVPGEDLRSSIRRFGQLPIGKSISIAKQICEGLAEAHRLGVVHRDLKSSNIMIDKEGDARIMDFGIARSLEAKGITGSGVIIGTPEYMSPEQVEGKEVDQRSDIYSLGVIIYEMVTGRVPFEGDTPFTIGVKHKSEMPKDPRAVNAQVPEDLSEVILKCMDKEKEKRYQKVERVLTALEKIEKVIPTTQKIITPERTEKEKIEKKEKKNSIAVLPFADLSPQKNQEYFCDGMAEEIINSLTKIKDLRVVARTSAFSFKGEKTDVREIGKKLNVGTVLEGSIRKSGNRIRVTTQLINVEDGYHLWSEKFDREMEDIFAIQDEISLAIVDHLKVKLWASEKAAIEKRPTDDLEAYNLYIKGHHFGWQPYQDSFDKSLDYYRKAIDRDPTFALAYVGIGSAYVGLSALSLRPPADVLPKAKAALKKAQELDDSLAEVHFLAAALAYWYDFDWKAAETGFQKTFELNPGLAEAHSQYPWFLLAMRRFDEAVREIKLAQDLDPLKPLFYAMSVGIHRIVRKYDEAIQEFHRAIELDPDIGLAYFHLGCVYLDKGMMEEAMSTLEKSIELVTGSGWAEAKLGVIHFMQGEKEKANQILDELIERKKNTYVESFSIACLYSHLGHTDKAFEYLDIAYEERDTLMPYLNVIPVFDLSEEVYADPRYKKLLKKMNLER